jgi:hypothetical protein
MHFSLRFLLFVVVPYVTGMAVIWSLGRYATESTVVCGTHALFRFALLAFFTVGWTLVGSLLTLRWSRKR